MRWPKFSLAESSVVLLVAVLLISVYALNQQVARNTQLVIERAQGNAAVLAELAKSAHKEYSDSITDAAWTLPLPENMLDDFSERLAPFPETFARNLSHRFSSQNPNITFRLYSDDPVYPNKYRRLDSFAQQALREMTESSMQTLTRNEVLPDGSVRVRYASPIIMLRSCIECHNSNSWGSTRKNWRVGDVRGIREVSIILPASEFQQSQGIRTLSLLMFLSCFIGAFVIFPSVRAEVARRDYFNTLSERMNERAKQYREEAYTDPLSGLPNLRYFERAAQKLADASAGGDQRIGLILIDIDHFKSINDTYGHDIGDLVIRGIGQVLRSNVRPQDIVARIGGEEYGILLNGGTEADFVDIANRVRKAASLRNFHSGNTEFRVTVSGGVTTFKQGQTLEQFRKAADTQLYAAKAAGRNRVHH